LIRHPESARKRLAQTLQGCWAAVLPERGAPDELLFAGPLERRDQRRDVRPAETGERLRPLRATYWFGASFTAPDGWGIYFDFEVRRALAASDSLEPGFGGQLRNELNPVHELAQERFGRQAWPGSTRRRRPGLGPIRARRREGARFGKVLDEPIADAVVEDGEGIVPYCPQELITVLLD
jgi:hypothetical protein